MKHILLSSLLLLFSLSAFAQDMSSLLEKGKNAEELHLWDLAHSYYSQAQAADVESPLPNIHLGLLAEKRCLFGQAASHFAYAAKLCDDIPETHVPIDSTTPSLAATSYEHWIYNMVEDENFGDLDNMVSVAEKAIEYNPKSASAHTSMALIVCQQKNFTNAINWAKKAIAIDSKYPRAYNALGVIYYHQGKDSEAINQFRTALKIDPDNMDCYYNLGVMYVLRGNHETAISYLKKGLLRDNKSVRLYYYLGVAYIQRGDTPKAILCYETIINQIDSLFTPAFNRLGAIYCGKGDYDKAIAYHQKASRIDPQDPESYKCLGQVNTVRGDYVKATRNYQKAVQIRPSDHETYCLIAKLYAKQGNKSRETSNYKKAAKLGNKEAQQWMVKNGMAW